MNLKIYLKLVRWPNLLMIVISMYFMRHFVIQPFFSLYGFKLFMGHFDFFILVFSTILLAAAGYIINDYFDQKIDMHNHPDRIIVGKKIDRREAQILHLILNGVAIMMGFYLAWIVKHWVFSLIFPVVSGIFWYYSTTYKKMLLVGNLVVAILTALPPLGVFMFEILLLFQKSGLQAVTDGFSFRPVAIIILFFSAFAFITNLIREFIKDLEDLHGDFIYGRKSLPVILGVGWAKSITLILIFLTSLAIIGIAVYLLDPFTLIYFPLCLVLPLFYLFYLVARARDAFAFHKASLWLKGIMLAGLCYAPVIYYIITFKIK